MSRLARPLHPLAMAVVMVRMMGVRLFLGEGFLAVQAQLLHDRRHFIENVVWIEPHPDAHPGVSHHAHGVMQHVYIDMLTPKAKQAVFEALANLVPDQASLTASV